MTRSPPAAPIAPAEYARRRRDLATRLKGAAGVIFAGEHNPPLIGKWRTDRSFYYLTGIDDEAGAALLLDPKAEDLRRREILFLRALDPELEAWDGFRDPIGPEMKSRYGFQTIMRTRMLPRTLTQIARQRGRLACLHPFSVYPAAPSPDLAVFRQVAERVVGVSIEDHTDALPSLRAIKSPAELKLTQAAGAATRRGLEAAMRAIAPGVPEAEVQQAIEAGFRSAGASGPSFNTIVGAGENGAVLHYMANDGVCEDGQVVLIDCGALYDGYAADVTRVFPVSGKFSKDQAHQYTIVLRAQEAAIAAIKPGARIGDIDAAARAVIDQAGFGDSYIHGIGHQIGLEVHDVTPDGALQEGMVVTIEPGAYVRATGIGVRIEDDVLVTKTGSRVLTNDIPKTIKEVESAMAAARKKAKA
jgi:Xaa-Pro aminopeptidase